MALIELTTMSSKGQIVLPSGMRHNIKPGEKIILIKSGNQIILKSEKEFSKKLVEDIKFAKKTEKALKRYDQGKFKSSSVEDFLKQLDAW